MKPRLGPLLLPNSLSLVALLAAGGVAFASPREAGSPAARPATYPWLEEGASHETLAARFPPPAGFARVAVGGGTFAAWLRQLPMKPPGAPVLSHRGDEVQPGDASHLAGVVELDVGREDLQQCADAILRLRAEYLWQRGAFEAIRFRYTSGDVSSWRDWARGLRPVVSGGRARFLKRRPPSRSRQTFRDYLTSLFRFAGTHSLAREGRSVGRGEVRPGDFISLGGSPGHAVLLLDVARDAGGRTRVLVGQSYMPAQSFHVLRDEATGSPWFALEPGDSLRIATWSAPFPRARLRRFTEE